VVRSLDLQAAAQALVNLACARQANDNITVVLVKVPRGAALQKNSKFWRWALLGLALLILLAMVIVIVTRVVFTYILPPAVTLTPPL
jgi:uncharacterized membrane protein YcjF (UPF0283 family)